jgi:hypothetical protein
MKIKTAIILVSVLSTIFVSGCTNNYEPYKYAKNGIYYNENIHLKFSYPTDWNFYYGYDPVPEMSLFSLVKDENKKELAFGMFNKTKYGVENVSFESYKKYQLEVLSENDKIIIKNSTIIESKGKEWFLLVTEYKYPWLTASLAEIDCSDYIFIVSYKTSTNHTFNLTPIMESLECGEVSKP